MLHYVSLRSEFRYDFCIKRMFGSFLLPVWGLMSFLHYLCLFAYSGVHHCAVFFFFFFFILCTLCCQILWIVPSVLSNDYLQKKKQWGHSRMKNPEIQVTLGTLRGEVCVHKTSLTASCFIEELVPNRKSERPYISVLVLLSTIF
jgi:hypothetical protein